MNSANDKFKEILQKSDLGDFISSCSGSDALQNEFIQKLCKCTTIKEAELLEKTYFLFAMHFLALICVKRENSMEMAEALGKKLQEAVKLMLEE